jgi:hypothetical protein
MFLNYALKELGLVLDPFVLNVPEKQKVKKAGTLS